MAKATEITALRNKKAKLLKHIERQPKDKVAAKALRDLKGV